MVVVDAAVYDDVVGRVGGVGAGVDAEFGCVGLLGGREMCVSELRWCVEFEARWRLRDE